MKNIKNTPLYLFLLNIYRFRHCFKNIGKEFGFRDIFILLFYNLIGMKDKEIYLKNLNLYVKANFFVVTTLIEIYNHKLYQNIKWLNCVLDLWAYIWESSLYLKRSNSSVICFEPSVEKFKLLEKNIKSESGISWNNLAVVADKDIRELTFYQRSGFDFCSWREKLKRLNKKEKVSCIDIESVLSEKRYDGLKMDIEGGEFVILKYFLKSDIFPFLKWIIEFHFTWDKVEDKIQVYNDFLSFLHKKNYKIRIFDNNNIDILDISSEQIALDKNLSCINLEFIKL